jgi:hypothetical protein
MAETDDDVPAAPGWDAIDAALDSLYGGREPLHYGTIVRFAAGGPDPLDGISVYTNSGPMPHWHYVSYGLTELYRKKSENERISGFGYEFTFRLARDRQDHEPPLWPMNLMQNLARASFNDGSIFGPFHTIDANGPIALNVGSTQLTAVLFVRDPQLPPVESPHGRFEFLQIVGITADELAAKNEWNAEKLVELLARDNPLLITDLARESIADDPRTARLIDQGIERDGSTCEELRVDELDWKRGMLATKWTLTLGAHVTRAIARLIHGRTAHGRPFTLHGPRRSVVVVPSDMPGVEVDDRDALVIRLTPEVSVELMSKLRPKRGPLAIDGLPKLAIMIQPTQIRDDAGKVVKTIG